MCIYSDPRTHDEVQLYPLLQSAYRAGQVLVPHGDRFTVHNDIPITDMDRQRVTLLVLLVLLKRLETRFGISGTVLRWFETYLSDTSQRIC